MKIVAATTERYKEYVEWWATRGKTPPEPDRMFFVAADDGKLLAGMCVFHAGRFMFAEHLATNPAAGPKATRAAVVLIAEAIKGYASIEGKAVVAITNQKGLVSLMSDAGFKSEPTYKLLTYYPS